MDTQTEKEPGPHKKTPPGWLWWSLLGVGLYVLDQASKLWIVHRFPLNYLNEKVHKYAYLPDFPGLPPRQCGRHAGLRHERAHTGGGHGAVPGPEPEHGGRPEQAEGAGTHFLPGRRREYHPRAQHGVAFGMGNGTAWSSYLFLAIPVLAIVALVVLYRKNFFHTVWLKLAYVLLLAGVAGNLTDRLMQGFLIPYEQPHGFFTKLMNGYVVDFIDVTIPLFNYRWPAFNVADSCIFVAAIIFFIASIFSARKKEEKPS